MSMNVAQKLIASHLLEGTMEIGEEIGLTIDQTLTQDATSTMVMLELAAMQVDRVKSELSAHMDGLTIDSQQYWQTAQVEILPRLGVPITSSRFAMP